MSNLVPLYHCAFHIQFSSLTNRDATAYVLNKIPDEFGIMEVERLIISKSTPEAPAPLNYYLRTGVVDYVNINEIARCSPIAESTVSARI